MLETCGPFGDNGYVNMCLNDVIHHGAWESNCESSRSKNDQVRHSGLRELEALSSRSSGMRKAKIRHF
jgi:hypothetical protein